MYIVLTPCFPVQQEGNKSAVGTALSPHIQENRREDTRSLSNAQSSFTEEGGVSGPSPREQGKGRVTFRYVAPLLWGRIGQGRPSGLGHQGAAFKAIRNR